ncbi:MAG: OmpA family protein [Prolixibacteraceae bacterium]|jgi:outer membrane protein OmpA-like peptidoglycan-associated protein/tetratricopeptide (TPR) repeat protein|nr:OmpA family protein [Prolixibacteraceae bacterium]
MWKEFKKHIGLTLLVLMLAGFAQGQRLTIKLADRAFHDFSWNEAIDLYLYAHEKDPENVYVIRKLADSYRNLGNTEEVEQWLNFLIEMGEEEPNDLFHYAMSLKSNGKYEKSEEYLEMYAQLRPEDGRVQLEQSLLDYVNFLVQDSSRFIVETVQFNTKGADWGSEFYKNRIVYVSTGDPEQSRDLKYNWDNLPFLDLYNVTVDEYGNYSDPELFAKNLKTSFHDGPATFDESRNRMYFNSNRTTRNVAREAEENNLQIYYADYEGGKWVEKGGFKHNDERDNYRHPSISTEGDVLYFSSDRPGGKGGNDIWWCRIVNGEWSEPVNLEEINTEGEEVFPFVAPDGVLYFASNGKGGMGGLDIYMALPDRGVFTTVENMGYPINTSSDDFGLVLDEDGMSGYFSSDRPGGLGYDDIYHVDILWIPVQIRGVVRDKINTFEVAGAKIALLDENLDTVDVAVSKQDGEFVFSAYKQRNYKLIVSKEDYNPSEKDISTYNKLPNEKIPVEVFIEMDFDEMAAGGLEPLSLEEMDGKQLQIIQIEHINYAFDSDRILPDAAEILDDIINLMNEYDDLEIIIESHTDSKGSDEYNLKLSKERAASAYDYLVRQGIEPDIIEYSGYGETQLLNHCDDGIECNDEEHAINRRSIIKVIRRGPIKNKRNTRGMFYF